jgi:ClpA/ClpB-like protein
MYERFTDRARKVMQLACQEAQRFNHEYIATEHVLLGLMKEGTGVAANVLKGLDIDMHKLRLEVEKIILPGPEMVTMGKLPQTPCVKKAIEYAFEEAKDLNHKYIGTEHLLLGLLREGENVAAQILRNLGLNLQDVREEVLMLLGHTVATEGWERRRQLRARNQLGQSKAREENSSKPKEDTKRPDNSERIQSLEQQLWNVRIVLGALVGAIAGVLLLDQFGAVMGLLLGGLVAALGWRTLGVLAGGSVGVLLGCTHLPNEGGGLAGALLGALVGFLIAEIGGTTGSRGFLGHRRRR